MNLHFTILKLQKSSQKENFLKIGLFLTRRRNSSIKKVAIEATFITGGEGGIRTLGTSLSPYDGLANR
jgi:hypothetical protein